MAPEPIDPPELTTGRLLARKEQIMTAFHQKPDAHRPRRSSRCRSLALAGTAGAAAAAAAVALSLTAPAPTPAYALTPNADGSLTFTIRDASDPGGATDALRRAGVRAAVMPGHRPGQCPADQKGTRDGRTWASLATAADSMQYTRAHPEAGPFIVVIRPELIPAGTILVIGTVEAELPRRGPTLIAYPELFAEPGPVCHEMTFDPATVRWSG